MILIVVFSSVLFFIANAKEHNLNFTKLLDEKHGNDVILKCKDHNKTSNMHEAHIWKYFHCDECDENHIPNLKWKDLQQKKKLHLRNITNADNGQYVCMVNDTIIASYQLKVNDAPPIRNFNFFNMNRVGRPPKIVDIVKNDEIRPNENVVVKCKIESPLVPRIVWLKQCQPTQKCGFNYDGNNYYKINGRFQEILLNDDDDEQIYVSILHLRNFTLFDNGLYVCVTVTELGKDYRNFTLILPPGDGNDRQQASTTSRNLYFLFLIPFLFILMPICIDCAGKRIVYKKSKQELLLDVVPPSTSTVYHC